MFDFDIDEMRGHHSLTRWRSVQVPRGTGRFHTRSEAAHRATELNDDADGIVRDRVTPRWRAVQKVSYR